MFRKVVSSVVLCALVALATVPSSAQEKGAVVRGDSAGRRVGF